LVDSGTLPTVLDREKGSGNAKSSILLFNHGIAKYMD